MRLLLDTHALIWWSQDHPHLSVAARSAIDDPAAEVFVSVASIWEIAIKVGSGKLPEAEAFIKALEVDTDIPGMAILPIVVAHAVHAGTLAIPHKDPFDRLLIAQAQLEGLTLVSNERIFDRFGVARLWD